MFLKGNPRGRCLSHYPMARPLTQCVSDTSMAPSGEAEDQDVGVDGFPSQALNQN